MSRSLQCSIGRQRDTPTSHLRNIQGVPEKTLPCLQFCVRVAFFKLDFLRDACAESWASCVQMKNVKLRILEMLLLGWIAACKPELYCPQRQGSVFSGTSLQVRSSREHMSTQRLSVTRRYYLVIQSESVVTGQWWKSGSCRPWWHCRVTVWCSGQCTMENQKTFSLRAKISSFVDVLGLYV